MPFPPISSQMTNRVLVVAAYPVDTLIHVQAIHMLTYSLAMDDVH